MDSWLGYFIHLVSPAHHLIAPHKWLGTVFIPAPPPHLHLVWSGLRGKSYSLEGCFHSSSKKVRCSVPGVTLPSLSQDLRLPRPVVRGGDGLKSKEHVGSKSIKALLRQKSMTRGPKKNQDDEDERRPSFLFLAEPSSDQNRIPPCASVPFKSP